MNILPLVKLHPDIPKSYWPDYPFGPQDALILLGEVKQLPGHVIVGSLKENKIYGAYDSDSFIELTLEEA